MRNLFTTLSIATAVAVLAGCGQTGPLYMPDEKVPKPPPLATPQDSAKQTSENS